MSREGSPQFVTCDGPVLTVEGGGTQTNGQLFMPGEDNPVALGSSGKCNPSTNFDASVRSVEDVWEQVSKQAGVSREEVSLCIGAAGLVPKDVRDHFAEVQIERGFAKVLPISDGYAALVGAGGGKECGMIVAGTGCAGHRMLPDGTSFQRDGWGWIGGDRGSGAWIGLRSLRYALEVRDGLKPSDALAEQHLKEVGNSDSEIATWFAECEPRHVAAHALHVFKYAEEDLARAQELLRDAAKELRNLFASLGCAPGEPLFLAGSIAESLQDLIAEGMETKPQKPAKRAQEGCRLVARGKAPLEWHIDVG